VRLLSEATVAANWPPQLATPGTGGAIVFATVLTPTSDPATPDWTSSTGDVSLFALDSAQLDLLDVWRLEQLPRRLAVSQSGEQLYILGNGCSPTALRLDSIHLGSGSTRKLAEVQDGLDGMATIHGDLFVLDAYRHRLLRFDTQRQTTTAVINLDAAPIAVAAW
jgi:hypothetical protein